MLILFLFIVTIITFFHYFHFLFSSQNSHKKKKKDKPIPLEFLLTKQCINFNFLKISVFFSSLKSLNQKEFRFCVATGCPFYFIFTLFCHNKFYFSFLHLVSGIYFFLTFKHPISSFNLERREISKFFSPLFVTLLF